MEEKMEERAEERSKGQGKRHGCCHGHGKSEEGKGSEGKGHCHGKGNGGCGHDHGAGEGNEDGGKGKGRCHGKGNYDAVSIRAVLDAVGDKTASPSVFYYYFPSKEALYRTCVRTVAKSYLSGLREGFSSDCKSLEKRLVQIGRAHV